MEQKEELEDELESAQAALKRKDIEIQQLRAQNEAMRSELQGEVRTHRSTTTISCILHAVPPACGQLGGRQAVLPGWAYITYTRNICEFMFDVSSVEVTSTMAAKGELTGGGLIVDLKSCADARTQRSTKTK